MRTSTTTTLTSVDEFGVADVRASRMRSARRSGVVILVLLAVLITAVAASLMYGNTVYSLSDVLGVIMGHDVPGASFTVGRLRLPRVLTAVLVGLCFGLGGVTFQTMLRNPLASPDIIGISSGASAAAAFGIVMLSLGRNQVSVFAIVAALGVALVIYLLSYRNGVAGTRLILIGIGVSAMLQSVISYVLSQAPQWDLQETMRWLTGSLNGIDYSDALPVLCALVVAGPVLLGQAKNLRALQLGDDAAAGLGVSLEATRLVSIIAAVGLIAFATAAAGPIAFVAFLSGPIASQLVGRGRPLHVPAALVGAVLVVVADFAGQHLFGTRFPVGVVTGALGAPYLVYLMIRQNKGN